MDRIAPFLLEKPLASVEHYLEDKERYLSIISLHFVLMNHVHRNLLCLGCLMSHQITLFQITLFQGNINGSGGYIVLVPNCKLSCLSISGI